MSTDVRYLDEVKAVPAFAGGAAASSVVREQGGRGRARRLLFSSSVSVFRQSVEEETPRRSGPSKPEPTQTRPKRRGSEPASPRIASAGHTVRSQLHSKVCGPFVLTVTLMEGSLKRHECASPFLRLKAKGEMEKNGHKRKM
ncbi:hypothetical protein F2P81_022381 [Scophthalmus maximus]|uniref:Uncharacterized protein n=1 Tax=Scophthalmus maximus TaxID=52904 RepID=A0A6A4S1I8_SCOMX|nr:hypothetical protein F2P81_022381 [Scophthalmus maximus]